MANMDNSSRRDATNPEGTDVTALDAQLHNLALQPQPRSPPRISDTRGRVDKASPQYRKPVAQKHVPQATPSSLTSPSQSHDLIAEFSSSGAAPSDATTYVSREPLVETIVDPYPESELATYHLMRMRALDGHDPSAKRRILHFELRTLPDGLCVVSNLLDYRCHWAIPPGWRIVDLGFGIPTYVSPTGDLSSYNPLEADVRAEQRAKRISLQHVREAHSCLHCRKVTIDCRVSMTRAFILASRPLQDRLIRVADTFDQVELAQREGCTLFKRLFPPIAQSRKAEWYYEGARSGIYLSIGGKSHVDNAWDKLDSGFKRKMDHAREKLVYQLNAYGHLMKPMILCGDPDMLDFGLYDRFGGPLEKSQVGDNKSWAWATMMLEKCVENHRDCAIHAAHDLSSVIMPTRLIDVFVAPHYVRLVQTDQLTGPSGPRSALPQWCCLSYVWGAKPQPVLTELGNVREHEAGISLSRLPNTIRDAVTACRSLRIKYLWVDALCIIQDDGQNKIKELAKMGEIYQNAALTIIAACASGVEEGFLDPKGYYSKGATAPPIRLSCIGQAGKTQSVVAFEEPLRTLDDGNPIEERGWTLQERVLTRRALYYGYRGASFMCRSAIMRNMNFFMDDKYLPEDMPARRLEVVSAPTFSSSWMQIVEDYSARKLTQPQKDKLNAIAAIAQFYTPRSIREETSSDIFQNSIQEFTTRRPTWKPYTVQRNYMRPDRYAAGVMTTAHDLTWLVHPSKPLCPRPAGGYRAPSWSWAAIDNPVVYWALDRYKGSEYALHGDDPIMHKDTDALASVAFHTEPENAELPYGTVVSGMLRISKASVCPVHWRDGGGRFDSVRLPSGDPITAHPDYEGAELEGTDAPTGGPRPHLWAVLIAGHKKSQYCGLLLRAIRGGTNAGELRTVRVGFWTCCDRSYHHWDGMLGLPGKWCKHKRSQFHPHRGVIVVE